MQVIPATIYPCNTYVFRCHSLDTAKEDLKAIYEEYYKYILTEYFDNPGYTIRLPNGSVIVLLNEEYINNIPIIVHEAFHVTEFIMDYVHTPLTDDTSEPYAYLLGYIVEQILK